MNSKPSYWLRENSRHVNSRAFSGNWRKSAVPRMALSFEWANSQRDPALGYLGASRT